MEISNLSSYYFVVVPEYFQPNAPDNLIFLDYDSLTNFLNYTSYKCGVEIGLISKDTSNDL